MNTDQIRRAVVGFSGSIGPTALNNPATAASPATIESVGVVLEAAKQVAPGELDHVRVSRTMNYAGLLDVILQLEQVFPREAELIGPGYPDD